MGVDGFDLRGQGAELQQMAHIIAVGQLVVVGRELAGKRGAGDWESA